MRRVLTVLTVLMLVLALGGPVQAKVTIGGALSLETTYGYINAEAGGTETFSLQRFGVGEGAIGFEYTSDDEKFQAVAELSIYGRSDGNTVELSQGFFSYNPGNWSILFGQTDHTSDLLGPSQTINDGGALEGFGNSVLDTTEQIIFTCGEKYVFIFGLDSVYHDPIWANAAQKTWLPGLTLAMELNFGNVLIHPWGHYEYLQNDANDDYHSLDLGLDIHGDFGLVGFTVGASYGLNSAQNDPVGGGLPSMVNDVVTDNATNIGVYGELRIGGLAVGAGYAQGSRDDWAENPYTYGAYVNYTIEFGAITFVPEIVWYNHGQDETGADQGDTILVGLWSQLEF